MSLRLVLRLFFLATGLVFRTDGSSVTCAVPASQSDAQLCCRKQSAVLPYLSTTDELEYVYNTMTKNKWNSVWLDLRRRRFNSWQWVNGNSFGASPVGIKGNCAYYNTTDKKTYRAPCSEESHGYVCQKKGCELCEGLDIDFDDCKKYSDSCYIHYCKRKNWLNARNHCEKQQMDLAITQNKNAFPHHIRKGCESFWIAASKETWKGKGSYNKSVGLWGKGEPSEKGDCSMFRLTENDYLIHAEDCSKKYSSVCIASLDDGENIETTNVFTQSFRYQNQSSSIPTEDSKLIIILTSVIGFLLLGGFVVSLICIFFYKKRVQSRINGPESNPLLGSKGVKKLMEKVARRIIRRYDRIRSCSMNEEDDTLPLGDLYTTLSLRLVGAKAESGSPEGYQRILNHLRGKMSGSYILVYGEPGSGKTTLAKRIPIDWAHSVLERKHKTPDLSRFTLVLPIFLRHVEEKNKRFKDIVDDMISLTDDETAIVSDLLEKQSESILIVCDGYDECNLENCSEIINLFKGRLQSINAIVMSRDSGFLPLDNTSDLPDSTFRLCGFSEVKTEEYIQKFFRERKDGEKGDGLLKKIKESGNEYLKNLGQNPAILFFMCDMWYKGLLPTKDAAKFYMAVTKYILVRYELKYVKAEQRTTQDAIVSKYKDQLFKLGRFAIENIKAEDQLQEFNRSHVMESVGDVWNFGFLKCTTEGRDPKVSFLDEHIMLFLAALYTENSKNTHTEINETQFINFKNLNTFTQSPVVKLDTDK